MMNLLIWAVMLLIILAAFFLGGREVLGELIYKCLPKDQLQDGDVMHIYQNGKYDRKATITGVGEYHVEVYETVRLPLSFRGKFYGYGVGRCGTKFVYVRDRHLYKWIRLAHIAFIAFAIVDDETNLLPTSVSEEEHGAIENEGAEDEE